MAGTRYDKLLIYNCETNQIGYVTAIYNEHHMTTGWTYISPAGNPTTKPPSNLSFLARDDNPWCVVGTDSLYKKIKYVAKFNSYTMPTIWLETNPDDSTLSRVVIGATPGGKTSFGSMHIGGNYEFSTYQIGHDGFSKGTGSFISDKSTLGYSGWASGGGSDGSRRSAWITTGDAAALMAEVTAIYQSFGNLYTKGIMNTGRYGALPMAVKRNSYASDHADSIYAIVMWTSTYQGRPIDGSICGPAYSIGFTSATPSYDLGPTAIFSVNCGIYDRYIAGTTYTPLTNYINAYFGGIAPKDIGEVSGDVLDPSSIYTPGGDTSGGTYNPYPGGSSGSNPGTNDPLNSGTDTTSTSTPGTWELPFDEVPDTPATVHSVDLGLYNVYALSAAQVKELANYLFSGVTEIGENLVKLIWGSKRDVIISLYEFPLMVTTQGTDTIRFIFDTDLAGLFHGKQLTSEYIPIDFGTIQVDRYSGTFYDFEPYTTLTLYIPYIGYIDLKPTEVVGSTLSIRGYVHLTTGELNVNVRSSRTGILGSYSGTIGRMLPIADADATEIYSSIIKTAASLGAVALAGAGMATASRAAAGISAPNKQTVDSARDTYMQSVGAWGAATRGVRGLEASMLQAKGAYEKAQADYAEQSSKYNAAQSAVRANREDFHDSASDAISNSLDAVTTGFGVSRGTVMTSSNGRVSPQRCFLRIEVPHQNVSRQQKILGYPANTSDALNSDRLHGYTELRTIELSIPNATLTEIQELEDILRGGFYLP